MLDAKSLDLILRDARTHNGWKDKPVTDAQLHEIYEIMKWGPTSANSQPARLVFVRTKEGKEKLRPALSAGNTEKTMTAPVTAIVAYDLRFHDQMPKLNPARDWKSTFAAMPDEARNQTAFLNATLQGAYVIIAARALGLDCGPMAGFDKAKVDAAFLGGTSWKSLFLLNLGYGDSAKTYPRNPRLAFDEAARIV